MAEKAPLEVSRLAIAAWRLLADVNVAMVTR